MASPPGQQCLNEHYRTPRHKTQTNQTLSRVECALKVVLCAIKTTSNINDGDMTYSNLGGINDLISTKDMKLSSQDASTTMKHYQSERKVFLKCLNQACCSFFSQLPCVYTLYLPGSDPCEKKCTLVEYSVKMFHNDWPSFWSTSCVWEKSRSAARSCPS